VPLVVGLGNPGRRYADTRHNAGWAVIDRLVLRWKARPGESTEAYRAWIAEVEDRYVDLMAPLTYMNLSGDALMRWSASHALDPAGLLVVSDDVYLPVGMIRLRARGSSGGHRGLESISGALESEDYARLRVGVGAVDAADLKEHVTDVPAPDERRLFEDALATAADAVDCWVREGILTAMNRFNRRISKEVPE